MNAAMTVMMVTWLDLGGGNLDGQGEAVSQASEGDCGGRFLDLDLRDSNRQEGEFRYLAAGAVECTHSHSLTLVCSSLTHSLTTLTTLTH